MRQSDPAEPEDLPSAHEPAEPGAVRSAAIDEALDEWRLARATHAALRERGMPHVNVLLVGDEDSVYDALETMLGEVEHPVVVWTPGQALVLPLMPRGGTVVLNEVGALGSADQIAMLEWLEQTGGRAQVISTASTSLLPGLEDGGFLEGLYYRLNTVYVKLSE